MTVAGADPRGTFSVWVVYDHPRDYPDVFVARRHVVHPGRVDPTGDIIISKELNLLRHELRLLGMHSIGRHMCDDLKIVETWL